MTNDFKPSDFYHAEYAIGCGGTETPIPWGGKTYLYVWNRKAKRHEYYVRPDDMFIPDTDAPWLIHQRFQRTDDGAWRGVCEDAPCCGCCD